MMNKRIQEAFEKWFCEMTSDKEISFVQDSRGMMEKMGRDLDIMDVSKLQGFYAGYLAALPKWVSVEDRLPTNDDRVLVYPPPNPDYDVLTASYCCYTTHKWYYSGTHENFYPKVTHWQPLPPVPEEGEKNERSV